MTRLRRGPLWLWYSIVFILIVGVTFGSLLLAGRALIWNVDGIAQHLPILAKFQEILQGHGQQSLFGWSWNLGLGADQMTTFAYYVVGDPFNYLMALIPATKIELGYQCLVILRLYVIGLAFLVFASLWDFSRLSKLIGALTYTFTAFTFLAGMHHPFFLLPMILFPLLIWGIERVFRGYAWWPLAIITGLTVASNVYFTYLLGLGSLIFALWRYWQLNRQQQLILKFWAVLRRLLSAVIVGIASAGVLLVPTVMVMLHSTRTGDRFASGMWTYPLSYYLALPNLVLSNNGRLPFWLLLGMSSLTFFAIVYSFSHFKRHWEINWLVISVLVGILIPAVGAVFNVMTSPSNRWVLLTTILFSFLTMRLVDSLDQLTPRDYRCFALASVGLLGLVWVTKGFYLNLTRHDVLTYVFLFGLLAWLIGRKSLKLTHQQFFSGVFVIVVLNLMTNGLGWTSANNSTTSKGLLYRGTATRWLKQYLDGADKGLPKSAGFYRTALTKGYYPNINYPGTDVTMLLGAHDIGSYYSVQNGAVGTFSKALDNESAVANSPLGDAGDRLTIRNLMGARYIFELARRYDSKTIPAGYHVLKNTDGTPKIYHNKYVSGGLSNATGTVILKNDNALPLVYTQSQQISAQDFKSLSAVNREQALLQGTVVSKKLSTVKTIEPKPVAKTVDYQVKVKHGQVIDTTKKLNDARRKQGQSLVLNPNAQLQQLIKDNQKIVHQNKLANQNGLTKLTSDRQGKQLTYQLVLAHPEKLKNKELYLELSGISYQASSLSRNLNLMGTQKIFDGEVQTRFDKMNQVRQVLTTSPSIGGYHFSASTTTHRAKYIQQSPTNLSNYIVRDHMLLNLGYSRHLRKTVTIRFTHAKNVSFKKAKIVAVDFDKSYQAKVKKVQQNGLQNLVVKNNSVTGTTNNSAASVLTTSIPYSNGWQLQVDGQSVVTQVVNDGFVGAKLSAGRHHVKLVYRTPGLKLGLGLTILGLFALIGAVLWHWLRFPIRSKRQH